jgi:hypothetical protein
MKKLIVFSLLFISVATFAQRAPQAQMSLNGATATAKSGIDLKKVESNVSELASVIELTEQQKEMFRELFTTKLRMLNDATGASEERKTIIYQTIARKIEASLPADQFEKLKANKEVFHNITH